MWFKEPQGRSWQESQWPKTGWKWPKMKMSWLRISTTSHSRTFFLPIVFFSRFHFLHCIGVQFLFKRIFLRVDVYFQRELRIRMYPWFFPRRGWIFLPLLGHYPHFWALLHRALIYIFLSFVCHFCGHFGLFILGHFLHFVISCHCRPSLEGNLCRWPCRPFLAVLAISRCKMTLWLKMIEMAKNWPWPQPKWLKDGQKMV